MLADELPVSGTKIRSVHEGAQRTVPSCPPWKVSKKRSRVSGRELFLRERIVIDEEGIHLEIADIQGCMGMLVP